MSARNTCAPPCTTLCGTVQTRREEKRREAAAEPQRRVESSCCRLVCGAALHLVASLGAPLGTFFATAAVCERILIHKHRALCLRATRISQPLTSCVCRIGAAALILSMRKQRNYLRRRISETEAAECTVLCCTQRWPSHPSRLVASRRVASHRTLDSISVTELGAGERQTRGQLPGRPPSTARAATRLARLIT